MFLLDTLNPFWDENILELIQGIKSVLPSSPAAGVAKSVAAVLSLVYLSVRAYAMIVGEGKLEVMQLFRPFVITMVIINFGLYTSLVDAPAKLRVILPKHNFRPMPCSLRKSTSAKFNWLMSC